MWTTLGTPPRDILPGERYSSLFCPHLSLLIPLFLHEPLEGRRLRTPQTIHVKRNAVRVNVPIEGIRLGYDNAYFKLRVFRIFKSPIEKSCPATT